MKKPTIEIEYNGFEDVILINGKTYFLDEITESYEKMIDTLISTLKMLDYIRNEYKDQNELFGGDIIYIESKISEIKGILKQVECEEWWEI